MNEWYLNIYIYIYKRSYKDIYREYFLRRCTCTTNSFQRKCFKPFLYIFYQNYKYSRNAITTMCPPKMPKQLYQLLIVTLLPYTASIYRLIDKYFGLTLLPYPEFRTCTSSSSFFFSFFLSVLVLMFLMAFFNEKCQISTHMTRTNDHFSINFDDSCYQIEQHVLKRGGSLGGLSIIPFFHNKYLFRILAKILKQRA